MTATYPKWFNKNKKPDLPIPPDKPKEYEILYDTIKTFFQDKVSKDDILDIAKLINDDRQSDFFLEVGYDDYDGHSEYNEQIHLIKTGKKKVPEKTFESAMKKYNKAFEKYQIRCAEINNQLKEWDELKKKIDSEEQTKTENNEKELYLELHKKYGSEKNS